MPPETCPNCGADVPRNAKTCPECGADEKTGWSGEAHTADLGIPDEDFSYDKYVEKEFGSKPAKPEGIAWYWWVVAVVLVILLVLAFVH